MKINKKLLELQLKILNNVNLVTKSQMKKYTNIIEDDEEFEVCLYCIQINKENEETINKIKNALKAKEEPEGEEENASDTTKK